MNWTIYENVKCFNQSLPEENRWILVAVLPSDSNMKDGRRTPIIVVGYMKRQEKPYFMIPIKGIVLGWQDCLPEGFMMPLFELKESK